VILHVHRRAYRELLITAPGLGNYISGAILFEARMLYMDRHGYVAHS
jgi:fructose-bisphosphate aldolase class 1